MSYEQAVRKAQQLLKQMDITAAPVDVYAIAERLGIQIKEETLGKGISGLLVRKKGGGAVIGISPFDPVVRKRFTIAHEIGHFTLHLSDDTLFIDRGLLAYHRDEVSTTGDVQSEREANFFAANLLMPKEMIRVAIEEKGLKFEDETDIEILANLFEVSSQAMTFRLINLGYLNT